MVTLVNICLTVIYTAADSESVWKKHLVLAFKLILKFPYQDFDGLCECISDFSAENRNIGIRLDTSCGLSSSSSQHLLKSILFSIPTSELIIKVSCIKW